ncbi:serine/threonine-protein kinase [Streptomyces sp. NRRL S-920]|uniref:serine/threonine-protein kinase n=1 Tax=Streptomyces sp. NRRL S-920 TaxID=1463921 RepID=UPI003B637270
MTQGVEGLLLGGRFRLSHVLGTGGFGRVWAAKDIARREARNAAKLRDHPHIVSVHDVVIVDEAPWIVMQLVTGGTLQEHLVKKKRLSVGSTGRIADALLQALEAAHQRGIVHRDVKPANVMVTADRTILLTDFGIATSRGDSTLTATGMVIGSLPYLSPPPPRPSNCSTHRPGRPSSTASRSSGHSPNQRHRATGGRPLPLLRHSFPPPRSPQRNRQRNRQRNPQRRASGRAACLPSVQSSSACFSCCT